MEKRIKIGGRITNAVDFSGQGAIFTYKPEGNVSDLAILLGVELKNQDCYYFDGAMIPNKYNNQMELRGKREGIQISLNIREFIENGVNITEDTESFYYGEFPQTIVKDNELNAELEKNYKKRAIWKTERKFTLPIGEKYQEYSKLPEYEYKGKKYIRLESKNEEASWIEVEPVKWEVKGYKAVTSKMILSNLYWAHAWAYTEEFKKDIKPITISERLEQVRREREEVLQLIDYINTQEEFQPTIIPEPYRPIYDGTENIMIK